MPEKWLGEGATGPLDPASKKPLALVRNGFAPVQKRFWVVQNRLSGVLCSLHPKDLVHPSLTTFETFLSGQFAKTLTSQPSLVAPYCAIPRDYLRDTPLLQTVGVVVSQHGQLGAIPPPPFLSVSPWRACEVEVRYAPHKRGISAIFARYRTKTRQMGAIPRKGIA